PSQKHRRVTKPRALQVIVLHLAHALDAQGLPREILASAPSALSAGHTRRDALACAVRPFSPGAPRMLIQRVLAQWLQLLRELLAHRHREGGGDADVMQRAFVVEHAEEQRPDDAAPFLVPAKAGDHAVRRADVLYLDHRAHSGLVDAVGRLRDDAVEAGAFEPIEPLAGEVAIACHRREGDRRDRGRDGKVAPRAPCARTGSSCGRRSCCGTSRMSRPSIASRSNATNDAGVSFASFAARDAAGCSRSWSASKSSPRLVAITISPSNTEPGGKPFRSVSCSSGK